MKRKVKTKCELSVQDKQARPSKARLSHLSRRLSESDRDAFRELFDELHVTLMRFCWRYTKDADASQDIVQEVFIKVWEKRTILDPDKSILSFMYTMVRNKALNSARNDYFSNGLDVGEIVIQSDHEPDPDEHIDFDVLEANVKRWIDKLPPRRREAFKLSRFEGLSHAEIAEIMSLTPRTVNTHVMLALEELRNRLRAFREDYETDAQES